MTDSHRVGLIGAHGRGGSAHGRHDADAGRERLTDWAHASAGNTPPARGVDGVVALSGVYDLAPLVGASLEVMERDTLKMRGDKPFVFSNQKIGQGLDQIIAFIERHGMLTAA